MTITNDVAELLAAAYPLAHDEGCMPEIVAAIAYIEAKEARP